MTEGARCRLGATSRQSANSGSHAPERAISASWRQTPPRPKVGPATSATPRGLSQAHGLAIF
eukprot:7041477-Pyramimonas_sp.AAC.1